MRSKKIVKKFFLIIFFRVLYEFYDMYAPIFKEVKKYTYSEFPAFIRLEYSFMIDNNFK